MAETPEELEQEVEDLKVEVQSLKETLEEIEGKIDDANAFIVRAFENGYEQLEGYMDKAIDKLDEAKNLI